MRAYLCLVLFAACTPEIVSGAYLCGENATCPEGLVCSAADHTCVGPASALPFACESDVTQPDDNPDQAYVIAEQQCTSLPRLIDGCMPADDASDWFQLTPPAACSAVAIQARVSYPLAFEALGLELWDLASNTQVQAATPCVADGTGESGDELRCLKATLTPGTAYGLHITPTGEGTCGGSCTFNSYTLRIQLVTP